VDRAREARVSKNFEINFSPNPTQRQFIESRAIADLFASRVGEGKSAGITWSVYYHTRHNPGARWAIIRDTWENLQRTTQKEFFKWFPPNIMGTYKASDKTFTWASGVGEGEVIFLGLDDAADASKLQSLELAGFAIDEPAPATESGGVDELIFDIGMSRLRQADMKWYGVKLAENNPDEAHWSFTKFVDPGTNGFVVHQTVAPENEKNLPAGYYAQLRYLWRNRPDLVRRFVEGKFGFQQTGKAVTPEWSDQLHLGIGLAPLKRVELQLLWDFGHNPTCIVTQVTPMRRWQFLHSMVGDGIGVEELIEAEVKPLLADAYRGFTWRHVGDPAGRQREQTSIKRSAVKFLTRSLGGRFVPGPVKIMERVNPLKAVLRQTVLGSGLVQVDRENAKEVWHALRGGWHYHVGRTGVISGEPVKNIHSHPGDAVGYGAAALFPLGKMQERKGHLTRPPSASFFGGSQRDTSGLGFEKPFAKLPPAGQKIG
jgi:hypothetical protein